MRTFPHDLRVVFRHFPLTHAHPHVEGAAEAADAAGAQGPRHFWHMHDLLFENQGDLEEAGLLRLADSMHLDLDRFTRELRAHAHADRVHRDRAEGGGSGSTARRPSSSTGSTTRVRPTWKPY